MPRYHALDTAVKLCVWDPQAAPSSNIENDEAEDPTTAQNAAAVFKNKNRLLRPKKREQSGPAIGYIVDYLKEEYFEGQGGVDFLAPGMPFYLVKAGRELFAVAEEAPRPSYPPKGATPTTTSSTALAIETGDTHPLSQTSNADIKISSPATEFVATSGESFTAPEQGGSSDQQETAIKNAISSLKHSRARHESPYEAVVKPIISPKPITIMVDLSTKSFMPSIVTNQRQELCITIFYNGELTQSRILRATTFGSLRGPVGDEKCQYYSGRRIDSFIEVPWVVQPQSSIEDDSILTKGGQSLKLDERWKKINQMLLAEADEWGRYGRFRSPMGEYLEELSKRAAPEFTKSERIGGARAGIIDVVITLGRSVSAAVAGLREPRRKIHQDLCGKARQLVIAPEELRPQKKAKIVAQFNLEASGGASRSTESDNLVMDRSFGGKKPAHTVHSESIKSTERSQTLVTTNRHPAPSILKDHNQDSPSVPFPAFADENQKSIPVGLQSLRESEQRDFAQMPPPNLSRRASLPIYSSSPLVHHNILLQPFPVSIPPIQEHQNKPTKVAQKRYKGTGSSDANPPPKRQKLKKDLKSLGVLIDSAASSSTRSRRAASSPAVPSPKSAGQKSFKGGQRLRQPKASNDSVANPSPNPGQDNAESSIIVPAMLQNQDNDNSSHSMLFGFDSTTDEPRCRSKPRSSTGSARSRSSLLKSDAQSVAKISASATDQVPQQDLTEPAALTDSTRIVFMIKNKEASSALIDRERFQNLQLQSSTTETAVQEIQTDSGKKDGAEQKATNSPWTQMNKYVTENHPSQKKRRMAKASAANQNAISATEVAAKSSSPSTKILAPKRQPKSAPLDPEYKPASKASVTDVPSENPLGKSLTGRRILLLPRSGASIENVGGKSVLPLSLSEDTFEMGSFEGKKTTLPVLAAMAEIGPMDGKTVFTPQSEATIETGSIGGKTVFTPQSHSTTDTGSMGGKTVFLPAAPPYRKRKDSKSSVPACKVSNATSEGLDFVEIPLKSQPKPNRNLISSAKQSNGTPEGSEKIETSPKTQSKPRSALASFRKRGLTVSEESEKPKMLPKTQPWGRRESVSSRELNDLFSSQKASTGIDTSFGSSSKEAPKKVRSLRKKKRVFAQHEILDLNANNMTTGPSEPLSIMTSINEGVVTTSQKTSGSRKAPTFPNLLASSSRTSKRQVDNASLKFLHVAIQLEATPNAIPSENKPNDTTITKLPKTHVWPVAAVINSSIHSNNGNPSDVETAGKVTTKVPLPTEKPKDLPIQVTPARRISRSYSVDSEGKKIPTPRKHSLPDSVNFPQAQMMPETPKISTVPRKTFPAKITAQNNSKTSSALAASGLTTPSANPKVSISETITFSTDIPIASRRKAPVATAPQQNGDSSGAASPTEGAAAPLTPKISISETLTFTTPAKVATTPTPMKTLSSQSKARTKRKADEISSPSGNSGATPSRFWKPTTICDNSVLGYASGEAWPGTSVDPVSKNVCRTVKAEREGVFRASGVLMGVRFVVGLL